MSVLNTLSSLVAWVAITALVVFLVRRLNSRWPIVAVTVAVGLILRAGLGGALFLVSYFEIGFLPHLQAGQGFWHLAPDARFYFDAAASAANLGLQSVDSTAPSPVYMRALALWLLVTGASPLSAILFNSVMYAVSAAMLAFCAPGAKGERFPAPLLIGLAAYSFSPALVLFSTQVLKDQFFAALIVIASVSTLNWMLATTRTTQKARGLEGWMWFVVLVAAVYAMAGVRAYYAVLTALAFVLASFVELYRVPYKGWPLAICKLSICTVLLWVAVKTGAAEYYPYYEVHARAAIAGIVQTATSSGSAGVFAALDAARSGFARSGGATNISDESPRTTEVGRSLAPADHEPVPRAGPISGAVSAPRELSVRRRPTLIAAERLIRGIATVFVPISLLKFLSAIDFHGGRGLLAVTDVDTLFLDITLIALLWCFVVNREHGYRNVAYCSFVFVLSVTCAAAMGYVVTNYGTLFRLRILIAVPLWMFALGLFGQRTAPGDSFAGSLLNAYRSKRARVNIPAAPAS
jgi:hypothetical protein